MYWGRYYPLRPPTSKTVPEILQEHKEKIDKTEIVLRKVWGNGYKCGKKQCKTPYKYINDEKFLEKMWLEIKQLNI